MSGFIRKRYTLSFLFLIFIVIFYSCSLSTTSVSIDEKLSEVDSLIAIADYDGAWSLLRSVAKTIRNPSDTLGVVRRALVLQRDEFAKDQLFDALKDAPDNQELLAVYTHMLLSENEYEKALPYAKSLEDGNYGSLYSELRFKMDQQRVKIANNEKRSEEELETIDYYSEDYVQAYVDIARSIGGSEYLGNASLIYALQGNMTRAFSFHPQNISVYEKPWFWAQISYDAHKFEQVVADLQNIDLNMHELALLADAYVHLDLLEEAQSIWLESTQRFATDNPIAWHNTALYYQNIGDTKNANELIIHLVETFPDYIGGLAAYGKFSLLDDKDNSASVFTPLLKERGLETLQMQELSSIVYLDTHDAIKKIDEAISTLISEDETNAMQLIIEKLKLEWSLQEQLLSPQQRVSDVWRMLEQNVSEPLGYHSLLVQYAMWFFFTQGMVEEAEGLFNAHITSRYENDYIAIGGNASQALSGMESWEYEYGAYIALVQKRYADAETWLKFLIPDTTISKGVSVPAVINATTLYKAIGKRALSLSLYEQVIPFVKEDTIKADVFYRMALIQYEVGERDNAIYSLEEALKLDFNHSAARLLQKRINE